MTVGELIRQLEDFDEDAEVRLAFQPSWPFEHSVGDVVGADSVESPFEALRDEDGWYVECEGEQFDGPFETAEEAEEACRKHDREDAAEIGDVVWIGEGRQLGYLPGVVKGALGWGR